MQPTTQNDPPTLCYILSGNFLIPDEIYKEFTEGFINISSQCKIKRPIDVKFLGPVLLTRGTQAMH